MASHRPDASALLDDRGYSGPTIRGQNPALLFEKGVRERIIDSYYWKEQCFGLNAASLCDRAADLTFIGGTYGVLGKPTPFLCLAFKLCQLVPEKEIILEYLNFEDDSVDEIKHENGDDSIDDRSAGQNAGERKRGEFKYLKALAAFYIRLAWDSVEIHKHLEPLLLDYRKLKRRTREGFALTSVDQFIDDLLTKDRVCATALWKMTSRAILEEEGKLEERESPMQAEIEAMDESGSESGRSRRGSSEGSEDGEETHRQNGRSSRSQSAES